MRIDTKWVLGILAIFINIYSNNISITPFQKSFLNKSVLRQIFIFSIVYMSTKDLEKSFILTGTFIILSSYILNEKSNLCIIPKYIIDTNKDGIIDKSELENAVNISNDYHNLSKKQT
jgi:hypothetical protein